MGTVSYTSAQTGARVTSGDPLLGIEVMKLVYQVSAPLGGEVEYVVKVGETVSEGQIVAKIYV